MSLLLAGYRKQRCMHYLTMTAKQSMCFAQLLFYAGQSDLATK